MKNHAGYTETTSRVHGPPGSTRGTGKDRVRTLKTKNKSIIGQNAGVRFSNILHDEEDESGFSDALAALKNMKSSDFFGEGQEDVSVEKYDSDDGNDDPTFVAIRNADGSLLCTASYYGNIWRIRIKRKQCMTSIYLYADGTMKIYNHQDTDKFKGTVCRVTLPT